MPQQWSEKQERKYEHIVDSAKSRGASTSRAKEIGARTVNKERAQKGETKSSSSRSRSGSSSSGNGGQTKEQLYQQAKRLGIDGRSKMSKQQLQRAVSRRK